MLFQFALKPGKQRKRIRGRTSKACQDAVMIDLAYFSRLIFHNRVIKTHLAVTGHGDLLSLPDTENGCTAYHEAPCARRARGWALSYTSRIRSVLTWTYFWVVD